MKVLRLAIVVPRGAALDRPLHFPYLNNERAGISIEVLQHYVTPASERRFVVGAIAQLTEPPSLNDAGLVRVPHSIRQACEQLIQSAADVFSVMESVGRSVLSPKPCIALMPESDAETDLLRTAKGIEAPNASIVSTSAAIDDALMPQLLDRLDGVASMAEANSSTTVIGEFHELMRVFERAFAVNGGGLVGPLTKFLEGADRLGYTKSEVQTFVRETKNISSHLEAWKQRDFYLDASSRALTGRMRQAALDVLFNKRVWHNPAPARREVWRPSVGTSAPGAPFVVEGEEAAASFEVLDPYGAFPLDAAAENLVPEGWYSWPSDPSAGFRVKKRAKQA